MFYLPFFHPHGGGVGGGGEGGGGKKKKKSSLKSIDFLAPPCLD